MVSSIPSACSQSNLLPPSGKNIGRITTQLHVLNLAGRPESLDRLPEADDKLAGHSTNIFLMNNGQKPQSKKKGAVEEP